MLTDPLLNTIYQIFVCIESISINHKYNRVKIITKTYLITINSKILELEEELKVVGNNMKSLEVSEQEVYILINIRVKSLRVISF